MNAMQDFKPLRNPGYTGNRHDDKPETLSREQIGVLSFTAGMLITPLIYLLLRAAI